MLQGTQKYLYFSQLDRIAVSTKDDKIKFVV